MVTDALTGGAYLVDSTAGEDDGQDAEEERWERIPDGGPHPHLGKF